jgi:hypothetical protein
MIVATGHTSSTQPTLPSDDHKRAPSQHNRRWHANPASFPLSADARLVRALTLRSLTAPV